MKAKRLTPVRGAAGLLARAIALLVLLFGASLLPAQFSGPALTVPQQANTVATPTTDLALLTQTAGDVTIVPGDVLTVHIFGVLDYMPVVRVNADGKVQLPLIGEVAVSGLTSTQAANLIAARLVDAKMYINPQVGIQVTESAGQFATVSGEVHAIVPINGSRRLLDVLAVAGSLPPTASHVITILRPSVKEPIVVDLGTDPLRSAKANVPILPRDTIIISRVGVVYVLGQFQKSGAIPLEQTSPLTLLQASALSGGPLFPAKYQDLRIIRTVGLERRFVRVDLKKIADGKEADPILQADDIIFLPTSDIKAFLASNGVGVVTSILSLLLISLHP